MDEVIQNNFAENELDEILLSDIGALPSPTRTTKYSDDKEDANLKGLLKSWNLEHLEEFLMTEKITIGVLKVIKQHHISALFTNHKKGDLILFEHHVQEWQKSQTHKATSIIENSGVLTKQSSSPSSSRRSSTESFVTLSDILNETQAASVVTEFYKNHSKFTDSHRSILIKAICSYFEQSQIHMSLHTSYRLEKEIIDRFPGEKLDYYRTGKRGKIYAKYCNLKCNIKSLKRNLHDDASNTVISSNSEPKIFSPESNAEECIRSIRFDNLSAAEFDSCWQACSQYRLNQINEASSLMEIFQKWPEYKKTTGFRYIDKDFGVVFGNRSGVLDDWPDHLLKIKAFLLAENRIKDKGLQAILQNIDNAEINNEVAAVQLMWCIHGYLVPTKNVVRKDNKKKIVKHTIRSSQESFFYVGSNTQEIEEHISFLKSKSESIQPFIFTIGDKNLKYFKNFFLYLDGLQYEFTTFLRAVDICFKCFHLFKLEYPLSCTNFWSFIEIYFYQMNENQTKSSKVALMSDKLKETDESLNKNK